MDDDISCPRCKTSKSTVKSLRMMVNSCGHGLCENCVEQLFFKGSGSCPICDQNLRRVNFRYQLFSDSSVEKEVEIRKRILKDYCKKEDDFDSLKEFNDYLEEIETIVFNLTNHIDVEETKRKIERYKKENLQFIQNNRNKRSKDELLIQDLIQEEKDLETFRKTHGIIQETEELTKIKAAQKESLVDQLMFSELPADQILASHVITSKIQMEKDHLKRMEREEQDKLSLVQKNLEQQKISSGGGAFSTGIQYTRGTSKFIPVAKILKESEEISSVYEYKPEELVINGPLCPKMDELESEGYLLHVRPCDTSEKAGGFISSYPCLRALQEAFCGMYFTPPVHETSSSSVNNDSNDDNSNNNSNDSDSPSDND